MRLSAAAVSIAAAEEKDQNPDPVSTAIVTAVIASVITSASAVITGKAISITAEEKNQDPDPAVASAVVVHAASTAIVGIIAASAAACS